MDDKEIYETATNLIKQHGKQATIEAAMKSDQMIDEGDLHAAAKWNKVMQAIEDIQRRGG